MRNFHRINILPCDVVDHLTVLRSRERVCQPRAICAAPVQRTWLFLADGVYIPQGGGWTTGTAGYSRPAWFARPSRHSRACGARRTDRTPWTKRRHWTAWASGCTGTCRTAGSPGTRRTNWTTGPCRPTRTSWTSRSTGSRRPARSTGTNWTDRTSRPSGTARPSRSTRTTGTTRTTRTTRTNRADWTARSYRSPGSSRTGWTNWTTGSACCYSCCRASVSSWDRIQHWNTHKKRSFPTCPSHCFDPNRHELFRAVEWETELRRNFIEVSPGHSCDVM